jgi:hypothetical protein
VRFPVSRARYDEARAEAFSYYKQWQAWEQKYADMVREKDARYDALLQTTLALKTQGATVVPVAGGVVEPTQPVARETDELKALIGEVCGTDVRKRAMMLRALASDRAAGVREDAIRERIVNGVQAEGVPA